MPVATSITASVRSELRPKSVLIQHLVLFGESLTLGDCRSQLLAMRMSNHCVRCARHRGHHATNDTCRQIPFSQWAKTVPLAAPIHTHAPPTPPQSTSP